MRIAIVAPSPNPFVIGGAENLWWGMVEHLNQQTSHVADLIKLPVKETSLVDLVAGYEAFSRLDMSGFDLVISTKYPAWMISHPNHRVFLQHRCRGYYDWYPVAQTGGEKYQGRDATILEFLAFLERNQQQRSALPEFFSRFKWFTDQFPEGGEVFRHPGPVGRSMVHFLDGIGLAPSEVKRYCAIAETVKRRKDYFPPGVNVNVVYHPTNKSGFHNSGQDYFFTVSRFYPSKRIDLLIDAYKRTRIELPFKIAGTGDEESKLRALAKGDPRFEFIGFVKDDELIDLYAGALAVPFIPSDEDFGYITLEAMLASKPVITTTDSGGPLELVRHRQNGLIVPPNAESLAEAFRQIEADRAGAQTMGLRGLQRAQEITWTKVFDELLSDMTPGNAHTMETKRPARKRITVLNAYAVHPPRNGGSYRLHYLLKALSNHVDVDLVTLALNGEGSDVIGVAPGFRELRVERTREHDMADRAAQVVAHVPVYDICALENIGLTPDYLTVLENSLKYAELVILSHPYMLGALERVGYRGKFIHEAQNCELALKHGMLPDTDLREHLLALVEKAEAYCCEHSAFVYSVSQSDCELLMKTYGVPKEHIIEVPNGTDTSSIGFTTREHKVRMKHRLRLPGQRIALFLASGHRPNLEVAERLFVLAKDMPDVAFAFVGNAADAFLHRKLPENVWLVGSVSEAERNIWLELADVALNPMLYGGGTNLKLLDYFAAGIPVVANDIGVRGVGAKHLEHLLIGPLEEFESLIRQALAGGEEIERMTRAARRLVEQEYDWGKLGKGLLKAIFNQGLLKLDV